MADPIDGRHARMRSLVQLVDGEVGTLIYFNRARQVGKVRVGRRHIWVPVADMTIPPDEVDQLVDALERIAADPSVVAPTRITDVVTRAAAEIRRCRMTGPQSPPRGNHASAP